MSEYLFDADSITFYLREVAVELGPLGSRHVIILVGGGFLAWRGLREATQDVDSVRRIDDELRTAVKVVADRHGLAPRWLNDHASIFAPATLREDDCEVILDVGRLRALGAPPRVVFAMKLYANRVIDQSDMRRLWSSCRFASSQEAAEFYHESYPALEVDSRLAAHLDRFVVPAPE